jgi:hypothetical protein
VTPRVTRRRLLGTAAAAALSGAGVYELVDRLAGAPRRAQASTGGGSARDAEQHLLRGVREIVDGGVEVTVPPLHHRVVTARVAAAGPRELRAAAAELEARLRALERRHEPTPAGLGVLVAWGLPYFRERVPGAWKRHAPFDRRAGKPSLLPARRFPSDPDDVLLEENDVAVLLRSDSLDHVTRAAEAIFSGLDALRVTSVRLGFAGGGFDGGSGLPRRMALAAGVPGADRIPEGAELFLGFTSTQRAALGPGRIANLETLGLTANNDYFRGGTHMHLSHMHENLERWYGGYSFDERVWTSFSPSVKAAPGTRTVRQPAAEAAGSNEVVHLYRHTGILGHSSAIQSASRLRRDTLGEDGTLYPKGTAVPQRADFNTLDNPFAWSRDPVRDGMRDGPAAGVHFVAFHPTSDDFDRVRLAMDGVLPDGPHLAFEPRDRAQGFNSILRTTHRQHFLVPPRRHRSFPLAELER